jgi:hypothetical protein
MVGDTLAVLDLRRAVPVLVPDPIIYLETAARKTVFVVAVDAPLFEGVDDVGVRALRRDPGRTSFSRAKGARSRVDRGIGWNGFWPSENLL